MCYSVSIPDMRLPYFILEMIYNFGDHRTVRIKRVDSSIAWSIFR